MNKMSQADQQNAFADDIRKVIDRYRDEFDLTLGSAVGVLEVVKHEMIMAEFEDGGDDENS